MLHSLPYKADLISIMMPAYNAEKYIGQAIDSVLAQTYTEWELIIINDGSTDQTEEVVNQYNDPRIIMRKQLNSGESSARNYALSISLGEFIAFLDADDFFLPNHLECMIDYLKKHPEHDAVYTGGYYVDPEGKIIQSLSSRRRGPFEGHIFEQVIRSPDVFGGTICILLRRLKIIDRGISFDPDIIIGPDWDFLNNLAETISFGYINQTTCCYRLHPSSISHSIDKSIGRLSLARCREKAIFLQEFNNCSLETKKAVFYDLLVNLLSNLPERRNLVLEWTQYRILPRDEQAKIIRIMANAALLENEELPYIRSWYEKAKCLSPNDVRTNLILIMVRFNPVLTRWILRVRKSFLISLKEIRAERIHLL